MKDQSLLEGNEKDKQSIIAKIKSRKNELEERMKNSWPPPEINKYIKDKTEQTVKMNEGNLKGEDFRLGMYAMWFYLQQNTSPPPPSILPERDGEWYPGKSYQRLFDVINESSPNPLVSQMQDIIQVVHEDFPKPEK